MKPLTIMPDNITVHRPVKLTTTRDGFLVRDRARWMHIMPTIAAAWALANAINTCKQPTFTIKE